MNPASSLSANVPAAPAADAAHDGVPPGEVITFYSYKGGTGRSMLLANMAWVLASAGQRVLVMDWDLEAPGLHRYFRPFLGADVELREQDGVMEWLTDYWDAALDAPETPVAQLMLEQADPRHYVRTLDTGPYLSGGIDLMCAGRQSRHYAPLVADFDFTRLFERLRGGQFIDAAKQVLVGPGGYDYVLVDSRTGVSDTSGLSTVALADTLVVTFTYNNQSLLGASQVARDIRQQVESRRREQVLAGTARRFRLYAVPSRIDDLDPDRLDRRKRLAEELFSPLLTDVEPRRQAAYWGAVQVRNSGLFAYEETLAVCMNRATDTQSVLGSVLQLSKELTGGLIAEAVDLGDDQRRELRERFSAHGANTVRLETAATAYQQLQNLLPQEGSRSSLLEACFPLLVQLYACAGADGAALALSSDSAVPILVRYPLPEADLTPEERRIAEALVAHKLLRRLVSEDRQRSLMLADDSVFHDWSALQQRLLAQVPMIQARDQLRRARRTWEAGGRSNEGLLALQGEVAGHAFSDEQGAWLGRPNLQFLVALREVQKTQAREKELGEKLAAARLEKTEAAAAWDQQRQDSEAAHHGRMTALLTQSDQRVEVLAQRLRNTLVVALVLLLGAVGVGTWMRRDVAQMAATERKESERRRAELRAEKDQLTAALALAQARSAALQSEADAKRATLHFGEASRLIVGPKQTRRPEQAIAEFSNAIAADPKFAEAYRGRALARGLSSQRDLQSELGDWAAYNDLRPSLANRMALILRALDAEPVDARLLLAQLKQLPGDAAQPGSRDMSPARAAEQLEARLKDFPPAFRDDARLVIDSLRAAAGSASISSANKKPPSVTAKALSPPPAAAPEPARTRAVVPPLLPAQNAPPPLQGSAAKK